MSSPHRKVRSLLGAAPSQASLPKYLARRNNTLYFKRRIPSDVAHGFPEFKEQVWKSLGTPFLEKAKVLLAVEVSEFDLRIASLRRQQALQSAVRCGQRLPDNDSMPAPTPHQRVEVPSPVQRSALAPPTQQAKSRPAAQPTMQHLFEDWKRKQDRVRTVNSVLTAVTEFRLLHGVLGVEDITKAHARAYRDHLIDRSLSKGTIENRIGFLSTLVRHGMKELVEELVLNPFEHIEVIGAKRVREEKERRAYEVHELNKLFSSPLYSKGYRPKGQTVDAAYWAPLLGPFLGARIEEICQARVDDVQRINGIWCIRISNLGQDQKLKTASSFRRIPLHDVIIKSGFLAYVAKTAKAGHERLFPTLQNENANGIYSNALGKWYGRYLETIGLSDNRLDYHSFRYTFKQRCSLCGIDNEVRDALSGHWLGSNDAGRTYLQAENRQYPFPALVAAIRQLSYEELSVSHLFVDQPFEGVEDLT